MKLRSLGMLVAAAAVTAFGALNTMANTIQFNINLGLSNGGTGTYVYDVNLDNASDLNNTKPTNQAGIVDFPGLSTNPAQTFFTPSAALTAGGWAGTVSFPNTNATAIALAPIMIPDGSSPDIQIDFAYNGVGPKPIITGTDVAGLLGRLTVKSSVTGGILGLPVATSGLNGTANAWSTDYKTFDQSQQNTSTAVPVPVPLPAAAWTGLSTLAGLAGAGLIRRRRSA